MNSKNDILDIIYDYILNNSPTSKACSRNVTGFFVD